MKNRYQEIVTLRNKGMTFADIGLRLKISKQRVWQMYMRMMKSPEQYGLNFNTSRGGQPSGPGFVYLMGSTRLGWYKIGLSFNLNPNKRIACIASYLPFEIDFSESWRSSHCFLLERELHSKLKEKKVRGEWFKLSSTDVKIIQRYFERQV